MAQDYYKAFGLGENDTTISNVDKDGINIAAIQALYERIETLSLENQVLKKRIERSNNLMNELDEIKEYLGLKTSKIE